MGSTKNAAKNFRFICAIYITAFISIAATCKDVGWTWDEVYYYLSSELQREWFKALKDGIFYGSMHLVLSQDIVDAYWLWDSAHNPHPPLYKILSLSTVAVFGPYIDELVAYRLATAALAAGQIVLLFTVLREHYGNVTGAFSSLCLLVMPLFFGHAHIAATEIPLAFFWFGTYWAFWRGLHTIWGSLVLSILFGCALATKFTSLLIPSAMLVWTLVYRERRALRNILFFVFSPFIAVALNPGWWHKPFQKIADFIQTSLSRHETIPISTFFMGERYVFSPPWYYSPVMTVITMPAAVLLMVLIGGMFLVRYRNRCDMLFVLNIPCIFGAVMLPRAPVHDGIRQFFTVLPFCAYLAGLGFHALRTAISCLSFSSRVKQTLLGVVAFLCLTSAGMQVYQYHPYCLSYYNELIGGLGGAYARGMEVTYWFDAVTSSFLEQINQVVPDGSRICVWPPNPEYFRFLQDHGRVKKSICFFTPDIQNQIVAAEKAPPDYLILLHRRSTFHEIHREILASCHPLAVNLLAGVPLVALYRW